MSNGDSHDGKLLEEVALTRILTRWTKDEVSLAVMGFRKYGQNFKVNLSRRFEQKSLKICLQAIAEVLGTKTESHVRKFFAKYRKSKNLDSLCQESKMIISLNHDDSKEIESIEASIRFIVSIEITCLLAEPDENKFLLLDRF